MTRVMVVTKFPANGWVRKELKTYMTEAGLDPGQVVRWSGAVPELDEEPSRSDLKAYRPVVQSEIIEAQPTHVLAVGGEALFAVMGRSGIMKYRGRVEDVHGARAFCTISPAMVSRNPGYREGFIADLTYFRRLIEGKTIGDPFHTPGGRRTYVGTKKALRALLTALQAASVCSYDVETTGASEHDSGAAIVSLSLTLAGPEGMPTAHVWEIPLFHPQSPWRRVWRRILEILGRFLCQVPKLVAHNAKFDTRWLRRFGISDLVPTFDTIIATVLLNENRPKGLKPLAQQILGADPWGIDTRNLLTTPLREVLEYNGLDTWHTLRLYYVFREQLLEQPRVARLFVRLMMPAIQELVEVEQRGVYVDQEVLDTNHAIAKQKLAGTEADLMAYLPAEVPEQFHRRNGNWGINFGPSNFARWFLFDHLELPILARGKTKDDGSPGMPSMAEAVMLELAEIHPVGKLMLDRALWYKRVTGFFEPYSNQLDTNSRIHTTFKPWGTVTGRLSSGKEDTEKVTVKGDLKGVNLQQVPRDPFMRGVFGAAPGHWFVEADYSQIELRIAAFLAREETMLHLYATGQDIHMAMAMRMTGKPASEITKEERKRAKAVNFGFLYGMGWFKFVETAWLNYQVRVSEEESKAFRAAFFDQFSGLLPWHARQRRLAHKFKRVQTPMGRIRHLPDIDSPSKDVRAEAERQAINSPVQGMASDMAQLSFVIISREFRKRGMKSRALGLVHDAVNFEIPHDETRRALPVIKNTMENLPLERWFGIHLDVPVIADLKLGTHWGGARELSTEEIYDWKTS